MIRVVRLCREDAAELFAAVGRSQALHRPWVTPPATLQELQDYIDQPPETRISYGVREEGGELAGVVNINSVIRGAFENGFLGFYALVPYERRGLMGQGLSAVIDLAFVEHELHRLEANVQPANTRSAALVTRLGFRLEGRSPRYLRIDGEWKDHDRYALTVEDWQTPAERRVLTG